MDKKLEFIYRTYKKALAVYLACFHVDENGKVIQTKDADKYKKNALEWENKFFTAYRKSQDE